MWPQVELHLEKWQIMFTQGQKDKADALNVLLPLSQRIRALPTWLLRTLRDGDFYFAANVHAFPALIVTAL